MSDDAPLYGLGPGFGPGLGFGPGFGLGLEGLAFFKPIVENSSIVGFFDILGFGGLRLVTTKLFDVPS